jgi:hypothetical protein
VDATAGALLRLSRAFLLSLVALSLGALAHVTAGGLLPALWTFPVMLTLCTVATCPWLGREASRRVIVGLLVGGQTSVHLALTALAGHRGEHEEARATTVGGTLLDAGRHVVSELEPANAPMAVAHLLAAAAVGLWLARGERALWAMLSLLARAAAGVVAVPRARPGRIILAATRLRAPAAAFRLRPPKGLVLVTSHPRRGPPVFSRAA